MRVVRQATDFAWVRGLPHAAIGEKVSCELTMWENVLTNVGVSSAMLGIVAFFGRSLWKHALDKDITAHRTRLQATFDVELERTKAELHKSVIEHEIRYRNIHEKVAETIGETYARLQELQRTVGSYVQEIEFGPEPSKETKLEAVREANQRFNDYFFPRQIYLPLHLSEEISTLYAKLHSITRQFTSGLQREKSGRTPPGDEYWVKSVEKFEKDATPLFRKLHMEFQAMLNVVPAEHEPPTDSGLNLCDSPSETRGMGNAT